MQKLKIWTLGLLNLYEHEVNQVLASWWVSFLYRTAMVIGWTAMVVFFVEKFGIVYLPFLLALHALGNIIGSLLFGKIVGKFGKAELIIYLSIICGIFFASTAIVFSYSYQLYLIFSILGVSVFLYQLKIMRSIFSESVFSPSQANRVFPVIESAETLGVIFGGVLVVFLSNHLPVYKFFLVMVPIVLGVVPVIFWFMQRSINVPFQEFYSIPELGIKPHLDQELNLKSMFARLKEDRFVFYLFGIVIFQFLFFGILEYHFTFVVEEYSKLHAANGYDAEKAFAADLGFLHTMFGVVILVFQLLLASRIINSLGVIRSMILMPLFMIMSVGFMLFNFSFSSVLLARFNQELMYVLHYNSYHASYYALSHSLRVAVMEFLEGIVRPLGTILATVVLLTLSLFGFENFNLITNLLSLVCLAFILVLTLKFKKEYHSSPLNDLQFSNSVASQMNALEIIDTEKQINVVNFLQDFLVRKVKLSKIVRKKIYSYIGENAEVESIYFLIERFNYGYDQDDVLKAINNIFQRNRNLFRNLKFSNFYLESFYEKLSNTDLDLNVKNELNRFLILFYLESNRIHDLVNLLKNSLEPQNSLSILSTLQDESDKGFLYVLEEFLNYDDTKVKIALLLILDKFLPKEKVQSIVRSCLVSSDLYNVENGLLYILKSRKYEWYYLYEDLLLNKLKDNQLLSVLNSFISFVANKNITYLRSYLLGLDLKIVLQLLNLFEIWMVDDEYIKLIHDRIEAEVYKVYSVFSTEKNSKDKLEMLYTLKNCYKILGSQKEYFMMKDLLS